MLKVRTARTGHRAAAVNTPIAAGRGCGWVWRDISICAPPPGAGSSSLHPAGLLRSLTPAFVPSGLPQRQKQARCFAKAAGAPQHGAPPTRLCPGLQSRGGTKPGLLGWGQSGSGTQCHVDGSTSAAVATLIKNSPKGPDPRSPGGLLGLFGLPGAIFSLNEHTQPHTRRAMRASLGRGDAETRGVRGGWG